MSGMDMNALDRWITGGRHSTAAGIVKCSGCGEWTQVVAETEYGATDWDPEECPDCGHEFTGDEPWEDGPND